jgi:hypothetical protein
LANPTDAVTYSTRIVSGKHRDLVDQFREEARDRPWLAYFCETEDASKIRVGSLNSPCRLEPVPFEDCPVDRFFFTTGDGASEELIGSGLTMSIFWNGLAEGLPPGGWQGVVRQCAKDAARGKRCNTLVGMQLFTVSRYRKGGLSSRFLGEMLALAGRLQHRYLIIPALTPIQFAREYVERPYEELAGLKRDDGLPVDHWARLHVRKGAEILGHCSTSHRFALSVADFNRHLTTHKITSSGYHVVPLDKDISFGVDARNTWQRVHADLDRGVVTFNWGCVWVRYDLATLDVPSS